MVAPLLSIVIVTRNRWAELDRCLHSIARLTYPNYEVVVIDNGSNDGVLDMVAANHPSVRLFDAGRNHGCGCGRNLGARVAQGEILWFVDDDAEVIVADAAERLVAKLTSNEEIGAIGGEALIDEAGRIVGVKQLDLLLNGMTTGRDNFGVDDDSWLDADLLAGCNVMVRTADFKAFGGFDPSYRHGWEDTDFSVRLRRAGRRLLIAGFAPVLHHFSGVERVSSLKVPAQSRAYFVAKTSGVPMLVAMPLLDLAYLLNPMRWGRILHKARRIDFGAKGRIVRPSGPIGRIGWRQLRGALRVALNYAGTIGSAYVYGWPSMARGIAARRHARNGWQEADPAVVTQYFHHLRPPAAAE
ncbi:MAG: glycosyltransferase [Alphaproteobacteria bacterium]